MKPEFSRAYEVVPFPFLTVYHRSKTALATGRPTFLHGRACASLSAMHTHEIHEQVEKAHEKQQKGIGLTTAVLAVLMAVATMLANNANTRKIVVETKTADWWAYTHSNDTNSRIYMSNERLAHLQGQDQAAQEFHQLSEEQKKESENAKVMAQSLEKDSALLARKAVYGEIAELFLEVSIVLCSVSLLTDLLLFWRLSFISTVIGIGLIAGFFLL